MANNHLEQLVAEWYEYQGYFIRRNVKVGKRAQGGYECELDIVGFHPQRQHLIHVEPSLDADSWAIRDTRYSKKFTAGRKYIRDLFEGLVLPEEIDQIAILLLASKQNHQLIGGGRIVLVSELLADIFRELKGKDLYSSAVDEQKPLLRTLQYAVTFRTTLEEVE